MEEKNYNVIGGRILSASRTELYMNLPYLDAALFSLADQPGEEKTATAGTDGVNLYYSGSFLAERYLRGSRYPCRLLLHLTLHCLLRHLHRRKNKDHALWDLACDAAVESILEDLGYDCIRTPLAPAGQRFLSECRAEMKVLTADAICRKLMRDRLGEYEIAQLQRVFRQDDHALWDLEGKDEQQDKRWKEKAEQTQTAMETLLGGIAEGGETVLTQLRVENRDTTDYRAFLRRFAAPKEVLHSDGDAYDPIWYAYGLQHYGNMPLIEPPETREEKRIEDLIIAVDTSMSTSGELVREFLRCTWGILRSTQTFTRRLNIHILQSDDRVRSDRLITSPEELEAYMNALELSGGSATDFRPVFEYADELCRKGAFTSLRGLIYFTDGMGIYPTRRPGYEAAFVFLNEPPMQVKLPPWAIRLTLGQEELDQAKAEELYNEERLAEMPEL